MYIHLDTAMHAGRTHQDPIGWASPNTNQSDLIIDTASRPSIPPSLQLSMHESMARIQGIRLLECVCISLCVCARARARGWVGGWVGGWMNLGVGARGSLLLRHLPPSYRLLVSEASRLYLSERCRAFRFVSRYDLNLEE